MTNQRNRLMAAVHATCEDEWRERFAKGALAITMHGAEAHDEFADALLARGVRVVDVETLERAMRLVMGNAIGLVPSAAAAILAALDAEGEQK